MQVGTSEICAKINNHEFIKSFLGVYYYDSIVSNAFNDGVKSIYLVI